MKDHSPIIVWLLLAANLCADLIMFSHIRATPEDYGYDLVIFGGLLTAQLSAVCVWSSFRSTPNLWSRLTPIVAVVVCSIALGREIEFDATIHFLPYFGLIAASLLILLWVLQRSHYWRQRTGVEARWRFSLAQIFGVMTIASLMAATLRYSDFFDEEIALEIGLLLGSITLSTTTVITWSRKYHWLLRLAGVFAIVFGLSALFYFSRFGTHMFNFAAYHFLVQAIVLVIWLAWGGIMPVTRSTGAAANQS